MIDDPPISPQELAELKRLRRQKRWADYAAESKLYRDPAESIEFEAEIERRKKSKRKEK